MHGVVGLPTDAEMNVVGGGRSDGQGSPNGWRLRGGAAFVDLDLIGLLCQSSKGGGVGRQFPGESWRRDIDAKGVGKVLEFHVDYGEGPRGGGK